MQVSERQIFGRILIPTSLLMWGAQRLSSVLLGPLVLVHMWSAELAGNRVLNALLLLVIAMHGYAGIRRIRMKAGMTGIVATLAALWLLTVVAFGAAILVFAP